MNVTLLNNDYFKAHLADNTALWYYYFYLRIRILPHCYEGNV